jgi:hypothetical protein
MSVQIHEVNHRRRGGDSLTEASEEITKDTNLSFFFGQGLWRVGRMVWSDIHGCLQRFELCGSVGFALNDGGYWW